MASARTVAVVVPSPAMSLVLLATSRTSWAPMFSYGIFEFDFLGDGDAVLGDGRAAEFLVEDDVAAGWPEGGLDGAREFLDAAEQSVPRGFVELELFSCHDGSGLVGVSSWCEL